MLSALQPRQRSPLIARQVPIRDGERITGFIDLALERAFKYRPGAHPSAIEIPADLQDREIEARTHMLEQLADHDDELLEQLLSDQTPDANRIFGDLARETARDARRSVLFGSASSSWGVRRLLKALRHETPGPEATAARLGVSDPSLYVFKVQHGSVGRLALSPGPRRHASAKARSADADGETTSASARMFTVQGDKTQKIAGADDGDVVAVAKIDTIKPGQWLGLGKLAARPSTSITRRATARSPSSRPIARMTSSCPALCNGCSRRTPASRSSMTRPTTRSC